MAREKNRPGINEVIVKKTEVGLNVEIRLYPSNLAFYDLSKLDMRRWKRSMDNFIRAPTLHATLTGLQDPIIEQMVEFLSSSTKYVSVAENRGLSPADLALSAKLLGASTIADLRFRLQNLDDTMTPLIISFLSRVTETLSLSVTTQPQIYDPEAVIHALFSSSFAHLRIFNTRSYLFFGLDLTFWESFLNEHLSNGSFE
ncbi:hypothetical protein PMAYCL1PPCAC_27932, partial [Pristionchus mayeri]